MPNPAQYGLKDEKTLNEATHPVTEVEFRMVMATPEYRDLMRLVICRGVAEIRHNQYRAAVSAFVGGGRA
jgi:hypothetical protein